LADKPRKQGQGGWRRTFYLALNPQGRPTLVSRALIAVILASTVVAILETEDTLQGQWPPAFAALEIFFTAVFAAEYLLRIWSAAEGPRSRLAYALMPSSLIDLAVVVGALLPFVGSGVMVLRLVRVARMLRLAKIGRFSRAFATLDRAARARASHLLVTLSLAIVFLIFSATLMYWVEGGDRPEAFGSIPRALWWATMTMTTVGYGDVYPLSVAGKLIAAVTSLGGIVLIAIPTGIFAAAFSDELIREAALAEAQKEVAGVASEERSG
jgi:voltage-gated potassium channel